MKKYIGMVCCFILALTLLVGCGPKTVSKQATAEQSSADSVASLPEDAQPNQAEWPRKIVDATGKETTLESQPQRITLLHSFYLEHFLALGTPPTACAIGNVLGQTSSLADSELFAPYLKDVEITDLGSPREINLEATRANAGTGA